MTPTRNMASSEVSVGLRPTLARNASYRVRQNRSEAALKRLSVPTIATSGS